MSVVTRALNALRRRTPPTTGAATGAGLPEDMIPAGKIARRARQAVPPPEPAGAVDLELVARRDRLIERFVLMQAELGGLYYEMAIRDHVRADVLAGKAAELQRVDLELAQVERFMRGDDARPAGRCSSCGAPHGDAGVFCSQCGRPLHAHTNGTAP
jgi:hypothetical protein